MKLPQFSTTDTKWLLKLTVPYTESSKLYEMLTKIPGIRWAKGKGHYIVPVECESFAHQALKACGFSKWEAHNGIGVGPNQKVWELPGLHPYQKKGASLALGYGDAWIFNDEMGLGKTAQAITTARIIYDRLTASETHRLPEGARVLVVTPAVVRYAWMAEFDKWWPGHPSVGVHEYGRGRKLSVKKRKEADEAFRCPIQVVSYSLLREVDGDAYDVVLFDEAHRLKEPTSLQSQAARRVTNGVKHTFALTATAMPDKPSDVWNLADTLWPGRFGSAFQFKMRYTNAEHNGHGWKFPGVDELNREELAWRMRAIASRTTKKEVAHLLPAFMFRTWLFRGERQAAVNEWLEDSTESGERRCVLTHTRALAEQLASEAEGPSVVVHGGLEPRARMTKIAKTIEDQAKPTLFATIDSIGEGIDLTAFTQVLIAQPHYWVKAMIQVLGRFSRLSGKLPATVTMLVMERTLDERIAYALERKVAAINSVVGAGQAEGALEGALNTCGTAEEDLATLRSAADMDGDDYLKQLLEST